MPKKPKVRKNVPALKKEQAVIKPETRKDKIFACIRNFLWVRPIYTKLDALYHTDRVIRYRPNIRPSLVKGMIFDGRPIKDIGKYFGLTYNEMNEYIESKGLRDYYDKIQILIEDNEKMVNPIGWSDARYVLRLEWIRFLLWRVINALKIKAWLTFYFYPVKLYRKYSLKPKVVRTIPLTACTRNELLYAMYKGHTSKTLAYEWGISLVIIHQWMVLHKVHPAMFPSFWERSASPYSGKFIKKVRNVGIADESEIDQVNAEPLVDVVKRRFRMSMLDDMDGTEHDVISKDISEPTIQDATDCVPLQLKEEVPKLIIKRPTTTTAPKPVALDDNFPIPSSGKVLIPKPIVSGRPTKKEEAELEEILKDAMIRKPVGNTPYPGYNPDLQK